MPLKEPAAQAAYMRQYRATHIERLRALNRTRRANPANREYDRKRSYMRRYGLTIREYEQRHAAQNGRCAICRRHESETPSRWGVLALDHSHATGQLRAFLCAQCNKGLGSFRDDPNLLETAAAYLRNYTAAKGVHP